MFGSTLVTAALSPDARLVHEQSEAGVIRGRVLLIPER
jgi:hypothetical protein